jgi:hypothetical protein
MAECHGAPATKSPATAGWQNDHQIGPRRIVEAAKGKEEEYSHLIQQMDGNGNTRPPPLLTKRLCGRDKRRARTLGSRFSPHMLRLRRPLLGSGHAQEARIMAHFSRF